MKNLLIFCLAILLVFSAFFIACSDEMKDDDAIQDPVIVKFLESKTFFRAKTTIESYGTISYKDIKSGIIKEGKFKISVLGIPIIENGEKIGIVEVVDLETDKYLPNGDSYALNYVNFKNFDLETLTGTVEMADLNYDNSIHSIFIVENNIITSFKHYQMPIALKEKYASIKKPNKLKSSKSEVLCDGDGDGDVSFFECYGCIEDAIDDSAEASFFCGIPVAGWASCWASVSIACVYISANY